MSEAANNPPAVVRVDDDDGDTDSTYGSVRLLYPVTLQNLKSGHF